MINSGETVKDSVATACGGLYWDIYIELMAKNWYNHSVGCVIDLEHFNIFCSALCRREDKAGKEEYAAILIYGESF
jgi:hypothetical protein